LKPIISTRLIFINVHIVAEWVFYCKGKDAGGRKAPQLHFCRTLGKGKKGPFPNGNNLHFQFGNEEFFALARKSSGCAEAYTSTPHKQARRLTQPGRKKTVSG
jgi:hypothetical protein